MYRRLRCRIHSTHIIQRLGSILDKSRSEQQMDFTLIREPGGNITGAIFFPYTPSLPAAYVFMSSFAFLTIAHIVYMFPLRSWYFISFILGCICESSP